MQNYREELLFDLEANTSKNDPVTDVITFDKDNNPIMRSQHKVIKNTNDLLEDRYLNGNNRITIPFDDFKTHEENLIKMSSSSDANKASKAKKALTLLYKSNAANRILASNPKSSAIMMQAKQAGAHILQAGASQQIISSLSMLASGAIYEIRDAIEGSSNISIMQRIKRLLKQCLDSFSFAKGASYGAIDTLVGILG